MQKKLNKIAKDTNSFLKTFIQKQKKSELKIPMKYGLFSGGKKIRSKILIDVGKLFNINYKTLIVIGSAVECIHAYSLIHDDLPCMDNDKIRRGKPSTHIKFGESTAVLAGNSLLTLAFEILSHKNLNINEKTKINLINKIYKLKKRPKNNPLIVHYYNKERLIKDCNFNKNFLKLYENFCPGPITFILDLKKESNISKIVTDKKNTLAVRFPKHPIARTLLKKLNFPLAAPSANISSKLSAVNPSDVKEEFGKKIKYILDGGKSSIGVESTIIDLRKKPKILRLGGLEVISIQKTLGKKVTIKNNSSKISVPGQFKLHYSPGIPIRLNVKKNRMNEALVLIRKKKVRSISFFCQKKVV